MTEAAANIPGIKTVERLEGLVPSGEFVTKMPIAFARQHCVMGFVGDDDRLIVAISDLARWEQLQIVSRFLGRAVTPILAPAAVIMSAINDAYQERTGQAQAFIEKLDRTQVLAELEQLNRREDLLDVASRAPVIRLVNLMLFEAVKINASDVHIQPYEDHLVVRTRIDGLLYDAFELPKNIQEEVVSRVKVMGRMNIAEKRLSQDGRRCRSGSG